MTIFNFLSIGAACCAIAVFGRLSLGLGYKTAYLPLISAIMYLVLEVEWILSDTRLDIGSYKDAAWTLVEVGLLGGSALLAWRLRQDFIKFCAAIKEGLKSNDNLD